MEQSHFDDPVAKMHDRAPCAVTREDLILNCSRFFHVAQRNVSIIRFAVGAVDVVVE